MIEFLDPATGEPAPTCRECGSLMLARCTNCELLSENTCPTCERRLPELDRLTKLVAQLTRERDEAFAKGRAAGIEAAGRPLHAAGFAECRERASAEIMRLQCGLVGDRCVKCAALAAIRALQPAATD